MPVAPVPGLRPTADRVRESLFNWLQPLVPGARCLDLFAGTGALGLEAASRGAAAVTLVEADARAARAIRKTIEVFEADNARVIHADALDYLDASADLYDLVFVDPPFDSDLLERALSALSERASVGAGAYVYLEGAAGRESLVLPRGWEIHKQGRAGAVVYCLVRVNTGGQACSSGSRWP